MRIDWKPYMQMQWTSLYHANKRVLRTPEFSNYWVYFIVTDNTYDMYDVRECVCVLSTFRSWMEKGATVALAACGVQY